MASKRKAVVHKLTGSSDMTACWLWAPVVRTTQKWSLTTCRNCLRKRPKPKGLRALILKK